MSKCGLCKEDIRFWQGKVYSEFDMYGDAKGECHLKCHKLKLEEEDK